VTWATRPDIRAGVGVRADQWRAVLDQIELLTDRVQVKQKTAIQTVNNSTALVAVTGMSFAVAANARYNFLGRIDFITGATPDIKMGWSYPTGATMFWSAVGYDLAGAIFDGDRFIETGVWAAAGAAANDEFLVWGALITSTTSGTFGPTFAQNTANASDTSINAGSDLTLLMQ
jgi:hypothetical protein